MKRVASTSSTVSAGCYVCNGSSAIWKAKNALAIAARHHDATGHATWAEQHLAIKYGDFFIDHPDLFQEPA